MNYTIIQNKALKKMSINRLDTMIDSIGIERTDKFFQDIRAFLYSYKADTFFNMKEDTFFSGLDSKARSHNVPYEPQRGYGSYEEQMERLNRAWNIDTYIREQIMNLDEELIKGLFDGSS